MRITAARVNSIEVPDSKSQAFLWDGFTKGFGVRKTKGGTVSYIVQSRVGGKNRRVTIGSAELLSCDDARRRAKVVLLDMSDGVDPRVKSTIDLARAATLSEVTTDYLTHRKTRNGPLRPASKKNIAYSIFVTLKDWNAAPVANISRDMCITRFRELSERAPTQTNQTFRNLQAILNWAREKYVDAEGSYTILPVNPVKQMIKSGLVQWNPTKPCVSRIPKDKVGDVWKLLESLSDQQYYPRSTAISADLLMFILLTGARIGEATHLRWEDVHLNADLPTFKFKNTKNHNAITLPISTVLQEVLTRRLNDRSVSNEFVFPSVRSPNASLKDPRAVLRKVTEVAGVHIHPHALRRTTDDIAQAAGVDWDQRRQLLNHLPNNVHAAAYSNNPEPSALLPAVQAIADFISGEI